MNQYRRFKSTPIRPTLQFSLHYATLGTLQAERFLRRKVASEGRRTSRGWVVRVRTIFDQELKVIGNSDWIELRVVPQSYLLDQQGSPCSRFHHLSKPQSERIVWLCEELEVPYDLKWCAREAATALAPPTSASNGRLQAVVRTKAEPPVPLPVRDHYMAHGPSKPEVSVNGRTTAPRSVHSQRWAH
jgi:hypothetical protein